MKSIITTSMLLPLSVCMVSASEIEYSKNPLNQEQSYFGFSKKETYDIAVALDEQELIGKKIKGLTVEIPGAENIVSTSIWLSSELNLVRSGGKKINNPDILSQNVQMNGSTLTVIFDTPYIIEGSLYAGYSFTVNNLTDETKMPVAVAGAAQSGGLFIHTSSSVVNWSDYTEKVGACSNMKLIIEGEFDNRNVEITSVGEQYISAESEGSELNFQMVNHGLDPVNSALIKWEIDDYSFDMVATPEKPIAAAWGASDRFILNIPQINTCGLKSLKATVKEINNTPLATEKQYTIPLKVYPFIPVNKPLVEEYTALSCGWCPSGYVALETMKERYPGDFIGLAYHIGDPMSGPFVTPENPLAMPMAHMNRLTRLNPEEIYETWPQFAAALAKGETQVSVEWTDNEKTAIKATSKTRFIQDFEDADFKIAYALIADGLSDPRWKQSNSYAPANGEEPKDWPNMPGKLGEMFTHGVHPMTGLIYNDVVLNLPEVGGFSGSLPSSIKAGDIYDHSVVFNLDDLEDVMELAMTHKDTLRVVAIIMSPAGVAMNCNTSHYVADTTGSSVSSLNQEIYRTIFYDLQGCQVKNPQPGMYIRVDIYTDGSIRTTKVFKP
ncbi:MAG: hypothetical protein NC201_07945 [Prevotella sp.]|nr:hypothetical protein [Bacteroides sp.]MCM1367159.1 hypothetical protein [Prevotella sp.]MCM1436267.1 hypothetical protein [Prevotella sp.]